MNPESYFTPASLFNFTPFSTTPFTSSLLDAPEDALLSTFSAGLKRELNGETIAASAKYIEALETETDLTTIQASSKRLEYVLDQSDKAINGSAVKNILREQFWANKINALEYYSMLGRISYLDKNYQDAISNYSAKLDSSFNYQDSTSAQINILDLLWLTSGGKDQISVKSSLNHLYSKSDDDYFKKREELLKKIAGKKAAINQENTISDFNLFQNYPNPFNPSTIISYALPKSGDIKIRIYNMMGALVTELKEGIKNKGSHQVSFNGSKYATGMYVYMLEYNGKPMMTKKMVMLK